VSGAEPPTERPGVASYADAIARNPLRQLDDIDRRLIGELSVDGRASYAALAPRVGLSQAAVRARVRRLIDEHIVTVSARVDPRSVGFGVFAFVLITTEGPAREVAERLASLDEAVFVVCLNGRWSVLVELRSADYPHLLTALDRVRGTPGVFDAESLSAVDYLKAGTSGIAAEVFGQPAERRLPRPVPKDKPLDEVDLTLIRELVADGRATFAALSPKIGLSQAGVRARVQRLLDQQIVVVQATTGASVLGLASFSSLFIQVRGGALEVGERLAAMPEFTIVCATSGRFGLACEVWSRDDSHLLDILDNVRSVDRVVDVESASYLEIVKEQFRLG
jgi:DNA-binding Lrp family transcriptional regulator